MLSFCEPKCRTEVAKGYDTLSQQPTTIMEKVLSFGVRGGPKNRNELFNYDKYEKTPDQCELMVSDIF